MGDRVLCVYDKVANGDEVSEKEAKVGVLEDVFELQHTAFVFESYPGNVIANLKRKNKLWNCIYLFNFSVSLSRINKPRVLLFFFVTDFWNSQFHLELIEELDPI